MSYCYKFFFAFILHFFCFSFAFSQEEIDTTQNNSLYMPNMEELSTLERTNAIEAKISVTGFSATTLRESPGIVTLISSEEIINSGAKDILDVLRLVPGFDFGYDVMPVASVRGNTGNEGKILFLVDGHTINDTSVGYIFLMQRIPLQNIDRIEIIRGAGSAIYGGMAGLSVVNVISKKTNGTQQIGASSNVGITQNALMRNSFEMWASNKFQNGLTFDISGAYLSAKMSDVNTSNSFLPNVVDMKKLSEINSAYLSMNIAYKKLEVKYLLNNFTNRLPQFADTKSIIRGSYLSVGYRFDIGEKLVINTKLNWKQQDPFYFDDVSIINLGGVSTRVTSLDFSNTRNVRYSANVYGIYQFNDNIQFVLGGEALLDQSKYMTTLASFRTGGDYAQYSGFGGFAEVNLKSKIANFTLGARGDKYANVNPIVVPRLAITRSFEKFHLKALYTRAFKNPTFQNVQFSKIGETVKPETFTLIEFEAGWKPSNSLQFNVNIYDIVIDDFISRQDVIVNNTPQFNYVNIGRSGTRGIEAEGRLKQKWGYLNLGYSFYTVSETQPETKLPEVSTVNSGIPAHKFTLQGHIKILPDFSINPTIMYFSNKFKINSAFAPNPTAVEYNSELHIQLYLQYNNFITRNITVGLGCTNLLDGKFWFLPSKKDATSDVFIPYQSREFFLRVSYKIKS
ncbi:MAG: hypothetical protein EAZ85_12875 [Bacteroidetes bacterium]|nr:MAG: hypothetical protein EAZ85_12875 [Bacteroidota bacterium]TAG85703.1 MAG: hypothetical protein EAZ20_14425 [Bacteroidota bacterium]